MSNNENNLDTLYSKLFDTMDEIDGGNHESLKKAKAMVEISGAIIDVAKTEHNVASSYGGEYHHSMVKPKQLPPQQGSEPKGQLTHSNDPSPGDNQYEVVTAKSKTLLFDKMGEFLERNKGRSPELISTYKTGNDEWVSKYRMVK